MSPTMSTVELICRQDDVFPEVVINGQSVHTAYDRPIEIHTELADWHEVTVTLVADKVVVTDGKDPWCPWADEPTPIYDELKNLESFQEQINQYVEALAELSHVPTRYIMGIDPAEGGASAIGLVSPTSVWVAPVGTPLTDAGWTELGYLDEELAFEDEIQLTAATQPAYDLSRFPLVNGTDCSPENVRAWIGRTNELERQLAQCHADCEDYLLDRAVDRHRIEELDAEVRRLELVNGEQGELIDWLQARCCR